MVRGGDVAMVRGREGERERGRGERERGRLLCFSSLS